jgi:2-C-methyl-D-erythritol 4-phosphate cytidylyltransferase
MGISTFRLDGKSNRAAAIVLAAGSGTRLEAARNKVFLPLAGRRVVSWSLESFAQVRAIKRFVMVIREADRSLAEETIDREAEDITVEIIAGGATRQQSELAALRHLAPAIAADDINMILIHDGARPLLSRRLVETLIRSTALHQAAFPAIEREDIRGMRADGTIDMSNPGRLIAAQTPQTFCAQPLLDAYEQAAAEGFSGTDTVSCWERYNTVPVKWVRGDPRNIKITYPGDLFDAEQILRDAEFHVD